MPEKETPIYKLPYPTSAGNVSVTPADIRELNEKIEAVLKARAEASFQTGDIKASVRSTAPAGWLLCEGQLVSRFTFAALFAKIGTTYGSGDGVSLFNLPDGRNRSWVGVSPSLEAGARGGLETVILAGRETGVQEHNHAAELSGKKILRSQGSETKRSAGGGGESGNAVGQQQNSTTGGIYQASIEVGSGIVPIGDGSISAAELHENMPPWFVGNYFIKT